MKIIQSNKIMIIGLSVIFVIICSVLLNFYTNKDYKNRRILDKYESKILNKGTYLDESSFVSISIELMENTFVYKMDFESKEKELNNVKLMVVDGISRLSYGIIGQKNNSLVTSNYDVEEGKMKGIRLLFDHKKEAVSIYIYLSFNVDGNNVEEFLRIILDN